MKVNKCECSRDDDDRVIESKAGIARALKEAGMPADVLAITAVGFAGNDPDFPVIYLINKKRQRVYCGDSARAFEGALQSHFGRAGRAGRAGSSRRLRRQTEHSIRRHK